MSGKVDLVIEKGATYRKLFQLKDKSKVPIDLTGYIGRMHIRTSAASSTILLELTTENGRMTITPLEGKVELYISKTDTTAITTKGNAVYDLELESSGGEVLKMIRGTISFIEEITR